MGLCTWDGLTKHLRGGSFLEPLYSLALKSLPDQHYSLLDLCIDRLEHTRSYWRMDYEALAKQLDFTLSLLARFKRMYSVDIAFHEVPVNALIEILTYSGAKRTGGANDDE